MMMHRLLASTMIALAAMGSGEGKLRDRVKSFFGRAEVFQATLSSVSGTDLTVTKDGKTYTINTGTFEKCTTRFVRRFGGKSTLSEFTVGDKVSAAGRFTDDTKTTLQACVVRDLSIQKRFGTFVGQIKSITGNSFVMSTVSEKRADQTVTVSATTKFVGRNQKVINQTDLAVGNRVLVRGLWNNLNNTVTEVTIVKDFSLPVKTATPSPVPTPTTTP